MPFKSAAPDALIVSGDALIQRLLKQKGAVVIPAYACRLDGFVNDTFTEYANASIYRPASVCRARLVSALRHTVYPSGRFYLGFTMYTAAGYDEPVEVYIGHRQVALARHPDPDNRVHLFVAPEGFRFRGGEPIRLVTAPTDGPCRVENVVLLPKCPRPTEPRLDILSPHVDVRHADGGARAYLTWITNRPASGQMRWGKADLTHPLPPPSPAGEGGGKKGLSPRSGEGEVASKLRNIIRLSHPLCNHEVVLEGLDLGRAYGYEVRMRDRTGRLKAVYAGTFQTDLAPVRSRARRARFPLLLRRPAPGPGPWPVSVGVPFPQGALGSDAEVRLVGRRGVEVPLQARTLGRWSDDSVRWALLDFQGDGRSGYRVEYGRDVARAQPAHPLDVAQSRTGIVVTTGPIRVEFPRGSAVFPGVVLLRQEDGTYRRVTPLRPAPAVTLVAGDGTRYASGRPDAVALEEVGPERACVRIDVRHRSRGKALFRSVFRAHLFRGSGAVRVLHTFENDRTEAEFTNIRELRLRADLEVGEDPAGEVGGRRIGPLGAQPVCLRQTHDDRYAVAQGGRRVALGRRAEGDLDLAGEEAGVAVAVRDFWQNYPKGIGLDRGGITFEVCPPLDRGDYPRGGELEDRLYYYLLDGRYRLKRGVSRTHEVWFHFRPGGAAAPQGFRENVQSPPLFSVSLETFNRSRAVTRLPPRERSPFPPYEAWVEAAREAYAQDREESRAYGMLNYGDWFGERTYNWGNLEYDASWCFLQEYLRGGDPAFYAWAEEAARHLVDVDTCHHSPNPKAVGEQYTHCVGHVGGYYPDGYRERAIFGGRWSPSHTWVEGLFLHHLLSGDPRSLEGAMKTSGLMAGEMVNDYDFTNCRNCGWPLLHLSAAYRATGRRVYLNAARIIVDRVLERQRPSGGWERLMVPGHCHCLPPRHTGNAGFMVGILMVGLKRYYEATGERRVREAIVRAADYCIDAMWVPEKSAFRYTSCPLSSVGGGADMRILKGVATALRFSGKERFREVLAAGVQSAMAGRLPKAHRGVGKSICSPMRGAPQVLVDLPNAHAGQATDPISVKKVLDNRYLKL